MTLINARRGGEVRLAQLASSQEEASARIGMMDQTISFRVVKEPYGWAVRLGDGMMTPFRSKVLALRHANGCADVLRQCGEPVEVVLEEHPVEIRTFQRRRPRLLRFN